MPKQEESKTVRYTKDQMFDLVADIDRYDEFLPWCNNSKIISAKKEGDKKIVIADLEIGYDQFVYTYRSEVELHEDKSQINVRNLDGPFNYLENIWKFTEKDNVTEVTFDVDFELKNKFLNIIMTKSFQFGLDKIADAFQKRAEELFSKT